MARRNPADLTKRNNDARKRDIAALRAQLQRERRERQSLARQVRGLERALARLISGRYPLVVARPAPLDP